MNRICLLACALLAVIVSAHAESLANSSGRSVMNAFLATYAKAETSWKKDIRLNETPGAIQPGRQLGQSALVGYYSFIPKVWDDLTEGEKTAVLKDPRLKAFIISSRTASVAMPQPNGGSAFPIEGVSAPRVPESSEPASQPPPVVVRISAQSAVAGERIQIDIK